MVSTLHAGLSSTTRGLRGLDGAAVRSLDGGSAVPGSLARVYSSADGPARKDARGGAVITPRSPERYPGISGSIRGRLSPNVAGSTS
jgi:hypothetical protein